MRQVVHVCLRIAAVALVGSTAGAQRITTGDAKEQTMWCFIGTTGGQLPAVAKGIYVCRFDSASGRLGEPELAAEAQTPSFLAIHPNGRFLYSTREAADGAGAVAFTIDPATGKLTKLNEQPCGGAGTCFVALDATGSTLLAANYGSGSLAALPVTADGSLGPLATRVQDVGKGPVPKRQDTPHAHSLNPDPTNHFAIACDLGTDQLLVFKLNPVSAKLTTSAVSYSLVAPGSGPRHLAFHPRGSFAYVANELSNTITTFAWDAARGALQETQTVRTLPTGWTEESYVAEVAVHPGGKFLYASNRGHDSIAIFAIDQASGGLSPVGYQSSFGKWPRHFRIDPTGAWLIAANEHSNDLAMFRIDQDSGNLSPIHGNVAVPSPSCVEFLR